MKRKTMAALLILAMILGTVGCTSGSDSEDKKTDTSGETTSEETIQEIAGIQTQEEAVNKIESALSANLGNIDGMICTGMEATVGMSQILSDYYEKQGDEKHIYAVGIDTDSGVMNAIENGIIDATIAQNSFGHGYISCMLLKYLGEGYQVKGDAYFIDSGNVLVTVDNIDSYEQNLEEVTQDILDRLTTDYLEK